MNPVTINPLPLALAVFFSSGLLQSLQAQPVAFGVKGGVPLDRAGNGDDNRTTVNKDRWIAGATAELRLGSHLSLGVDALYRTFGYSTSRNIGSARFFENSNTDHWEVPIYLKYRFGSGPLRPFVAGGGAFEHASVNGSAGCTGDTLLCGQSAGVKDLRSSSNGGGYVGSAGVEIKWGIVTFAPEFRYTRWQRGYLAGAGSDQPALLLGIRLF